MANLDLDAIEQREYNDDETIDELIAEVKRLRTENDAAVELLAEFKGSGANDPEEMHAAFAAAKVVAQLWADSPDRVSIEPTDYGDDLMRALFRLLETVSTETTASITDDPWTLHGEAQATLRADGEREGRR
jgi:hypothetical protein